MRYSHQREKIKEIVYNTNSHPTADWIFEMVQRSIPNISLGTVYRNLKQLEEVGIIRTVMDGAVARYDWNKEPHDHLKCKVCGDLIDVHLFEEDIQETVLKKYKFEVDDVEMTIIGKCKKHK
jgi:Fe2+ or Zn2+ uptake regulation protein